MERNYSFKQQNISTYILIINLLIINCKTLDNTPLYIETHPIQVYEQETGYSFTEYDPSKGSTLLGDFGIFPIEVFLEFFSYIKLRELLNIRKINSSFYQIITNYEQVGVVGVINKPTTVKLYIPTFAINKCVNFDSLSYTCDNIPSFYFYCLLREVQNLPFIFWPYIKDT